MTIAVWMWNWGEGNRYAIEPNSDGGYDTVVETGLEENLDREHWATLEAARARFRDELRARTEAGVEGAAGALAELEAVSE
ncbi:hypothetical protein [Amycolatopsis anabasis]|uniref:hypothetical protein n=1 Tax=Amycolatopsis anabasis TaxID=1840409 RepID=UPI00131E36A1|nr:hypothetical protein [Amycolatopsis anabasis]